MRFTLQHILLWQLCSAGVIALNFALGGRCDLMQGMFALIVYGCGCLWGIVRYSARHPEVRVAPLSASIKGIAKFIAASLILGFLLGTRTREICTRTFSGRCTINFGILNNQRVAYDEEAKFIQDALKYKPREHNWVNSSTYSWLGNGCYFPQFKYPMLEFDINDLHRLSLLDPVEQSHSLFELDNPSDFQLSQVRKEILCELKYRFGELGGRRRAGSDAAIVQNWWRDFEPLLRPIKSEADLQKAHKDWDANARSPDLDDFTHDAIDSRFPLAGQR